MQYRVVVAILFSFAGFLISLLFLTVKTSRNFLPDATVEAVSHPKSLTRTVLDILIAN
jgi:hypothetical protein